MDKSILVDQNYLQLLKRIFSCFLHELREQLQVGQEIDNGEFFYAKDCFQNYYLVPENTNIF